MYTYNHLNVLLQIIRHVCWDVLCAVVGARYPVEDLEMENNKLSERVVDDS